MIKVVGWTNDNYDFRESDYSIDEIDAIVNDIKENGYSFCGDEQEDGDNLTPVLSNGKITHFSWREWGGIMAKAHNELTKDGKYNYTLWYMKEWGPKNPVYPKDRNIDYDAINTGYIHKYELTNEEYEMFNEFKVFNFIIPNELSENNRIYNGDIINFLYNNETIYSTKVGETSQIYYPDCITEFVSETQYDSLSDKEIEKVIIKKYPFINISDLRYIVVDLNHYKY